MGHKVISFYDLPEADISKEQPNMFWPFGQHILEPAKFIRKNPNFYAILLTHHGCGPDSVLSHYFREEMCGKPYLHIEVDEHSSGVGVITRIEAFINSLKNSSIYLEKDLSKITNIKEKLNDMDNEKTLYLPYLYPYSNIFKEIFSKMGIAAAVLPITDDLSIDIGRKFTITEEYFSLTALLGDVFKQLKVNKDVLDEGSAFFIPQNEGTEVDGQYSRLVRTKLDEEGFNSVDIISPFIEDFLMYDEEFFMSICFALLAGDIVMASRISERENVLNEVIKFMISGNMNIITLMNLAKRVVRDVETSYSKKKILALGEIYVLYNNFLNDFTFNNLEKRGAKVSYAPLSEYFWMLWNDFAKWNEGHKKIKLILERINSFKNYIDLVSLALDKGSAFESEIYELVEKADNTVGYYSGAGGRYREAKSLGVLDGVDGIITVASMYENTGIVMNVLHKGFADGTSKPMLNLTFDGNRNENDRTKIDSFMYYL
jgi:predicted nucleotide-binding protein (sugar kinase/HSP70/actin superfamily)